MGKYKQRRKSASAAFYVPVAVLLIVFFVTIGTSVFLRILEIEVSGVEKYSEDDIISASGINPGENMLLINSGDVSRRIYAAMPYIKEIKVRFSLPDKVMISVSETDAFAVLEHRGSFIVIDSACKILEVCDVAPKGLFEIRGYAPVDVKVGGQLSADASGESRLRRLREIVAAVDKAGISGGVSLIDITDLGNVYLVYEDQFTVILGGSGAALSRLAKVPEAVLDAKADLSYDVANRYKTELTDQSGTWLWTPEW
ncbi:MAG: FtsQ-type POTRA domain-containing protein [Oscillospiraceae bacterium]|nr:FtsQ-type POTRA domain-containing protein [Oscillospiraceae bacterium]